MDISIDTDMDMQHRYAVVQEHLPPSPPGKKYVVLQAMGNPGEVGFQA